MKTSTFRPLWEAFTKRKLVLSSSGSWHDGKSSFQESGRTYGWVDSCPIYGLLIFLTDVNRFLDPLGGTVELSGNHCCLRPVDHMVLLNCMIADSGLVMFSEHEIAWEYARRFSELRHCALTCDHLTTSHDSQRLITDLGAQKPISRALQQLLYVQYVGLLCLLRHTFPSSNVRMCGTHMVPHSVVLFAWVSHSGCICGHYV